VAEASQGIALEAGILKLRLIQVIMWKGIAFGFEDGAVDLARRMRGSKRTLDGELVRLRRRRKKRKKILVVGGEI
jgi:hypothetical protein